MAGRVLVLNTGSSSITYELIDVRSRARPARGAVERIGEDEGLPAHHVPGAAPYERKGRFGDHEQGLQAVLAAFREAGPELDPVAPGPRCCAPDRDSPRTNPGVTIGRVTQDISGYGWVGYTGGGRADGAARDRAAP